MAAYYVFNIEYPKIHSQVLGVLQTFLMKDAPYHGVTTTGYTKLCSKLHKKLFADS